MDQPLAKILVVDDEPKICAVLSAFLKTRGYQVVSTSSGQEAVTAMLCERPDVVLLDIRMPEMGGMELFQHIRVLDPKARIIMITGDGDEERAKQFLAMGAVEFIAKPFDLAHLDQAVAALVTERRMEASS
jgi:two-component system nitrogen regulation response regulator GlnG